MPILEEYGIPAFGKYYAGRGYIMDQKKTLWIVIASGIFLFVVIGSAVLLSAKNAKNENTAEALKNNDYWVAATPELPSDSFSQSSLKAKTAVQEEPVPVQESVAPAADTLVFSDSHEEGYNGKDNIQSYTQTGTLTVIASGPTNVISTNGTEVTGVTTIDLNTLKSSHSAVTANNEVAKAAIEETAAVKAKEEPKAAAKEIEKPVKKAEPAPVKKAAPAASTKTAKKTEPAKKAAPAPKKPDQFWVQAASYSTKKNADEARAVLDSNGVQCEVFTYKDSANKLFYRVRVGPYTTKAEAEYWKGRIETIDLFSKSGSYVTNTSVAK